MAYFRSAKIFSTRFNCLIIDHDHNDKDDDWTELDLNFARSRIFNCYSTQSDILSFAWYRERKLDILFYKRLEASIRSVDIIVAISG